jgi:hypothetical protein
MLKRAAKSRQQQISSIRIIPPNDASMVCHRFVCCFVGGSLPTAALSHRSAMDQIPSTLQPFT